MTRSVDPRTSLSFFFALEAEVTETCRRHLIDAAVTRDGPIKLEEITRVEIRELGNNLGTFLAMKMRGKDQTMTDLSGAGNGFEALGQIYSDYRPQGGASDHGLLATIFRLKWWTSDGNSRRSFAEVLHDWDHLVTQYEPASNDRISERLKCANFMGHAPQPIGKILEVQAKRLGRTAR